jgi:hypothetical protein
VCFYQAAPSQERYKQYFVSGLVAALHTAASDEGKASVTSTPDARWLIAVVTSNQNDAISKVWPRVGCIGDALNSPTTQLEMDCVAYIRNFVSTEQYFEFGNAKDAGGIDIWNESPVQHTVVHCHQLTEDEDSHG